MGNEHGHHHHHHGAMMQIPPVYNPPVPYRGYLPVAPSDGSSVVIRGTVPSWCNRFQINLETDNGDVALHFNPRFEGQNEVIRNSCRMGAWGQEEKYGGFPFGLGQPFELTILINPHDYKLSVNGRHFTEFRHRIPKDAVRVLTAEGDLQLSEIRFMGGGAAPLNNPPVPFNGPIAGGMAPGKMIKIMGVATYGASRFNVNLVRGPGYFANADIGLHCDVRFSYGESHNTVVRTHRQNGGWGQEERHAHFFPFSPGAPFEMIIKCEHHKFMIAVNNQHMFEFHHRIHPAQSLDHLAIEGDVSINQIQFQN